MIDATVRSLERRHAIADATALPPFNPGWTQVGGVEAALTEHPDIADVTVIGISDEEWGKRVHAVVQPREGAVTPSVRELDRLCRERLASYKSPKTYEFVADFPRDEAGKIRRPALVAARESDWTEGMVLARQE